MKNILLFLIAFLWVVATYSQVNNLPIKEWPSSQQNPLVIYISGDGGFNNFSTGLCIEINKSGFPVTAINARSYFWDKKNPVEAATGITLYLAKQFHERKSQQWVLTGYSFGADVLPFIVNHLPDSIRKKLIHIVMLSPSTSTDFEMHLYDMVGGNKKRSMDVVAELNNLGLQKTTTIFGSDENNFPVKNIRLKNYNNEILPGSHHFDGNIHEVAKTMLRYFK